MKTQFWYTLLLALFLPSLAFTKEPPLKNVFHVDLRDSSKYHSSCLPVADKLKTIWTQIHETMEHTVKSLKAEEYNKPKNIRTRRLLSAYFGILFKVVSDQDGYDYSEADAAREPILSSENKKLYVQQNFNDMRKVINKERSSDSNKPKLMCGAQSLELQRADDYVKDKKGKPIPKDPKNPKGEKWKLKEWEVKQGRPFDTNWYFWYSFGTEIGYIVVTHNGYPPAPGVNAPWKLDPKTGKPSPCASGLAGTTLTSLVRGKEDESAPWSDPDWVILCPNSFTGHQLTLPSTAPPEGAGLNTMEIAALTFFHELFHVANIDMFDEGLIIPIPGKPLTEKTHFMKGVGTALGARSCMMLSKYEMAKPANKWDDPLTTENAESYAWMAHTLWLSKKYDRDFSTGVCRKDSIETSPQSAQSTRKARSTKSRRSVPTQV